MSHHESAQNALYRQLPSVDDLLRDVPGWIAAEGHQRVVRVLRLALDEARAMIRAGGSIPTRTDLVASARAHLDSSVVRRSSSVVINATGVILHTNLGRALLSRAAQDAMADVAADYSPLEFDLDSGERGRRGEWVEKLAGELTGAEAALIVNNCASATLLMLSAIARDTAVVISRGQLVEIGGGFRIPDILRQSGAELLEVGTTNRTRLSDYEQAIARSRESEVRSQSSAASRPVGAILRVHSSNFKMIGFTEDVPVAELVGLAQSLAQSSNGSMAQSSIPVLDDIGSGALVDMSPFGLSHEPMPQESVRAGAAVVTFSGDKLLGGPQAGLMVGQREAIERCRRHPLARAVRADKFTLAALGATLLHYARGEALREVPVLRMIALSAAEIQARAEQVVASLQGWFESQGIPAELIDGQSTVGGGSLPGDTLPTRLIALTCDNPDQLATQLRHAPTPVIARIQDQRVLLDLRTVQDDGALIAAIRGAG